MKTKMCWALASILVLVGTVSALPAADNGLTKSKTTHLYLYEKDPTDWTIVDGGACGKTSINGNKVVFNGHGLTANVGYTLITFVDPWPGTITTIGVGTTDAYGNVNIKGSVSLSDSVVEKVWLVPSTDLTATAFNTWNPAEYLFEYNTL